MSYASRDPNEPRSESLSPDDALPPVEAPSAGFILQLFVVPGVIVVIIVAVWLMFNWLAQRGNDPQAFVAAIKRNNEGRWQAAVNLANALNNRQSTSSQELRHDHRLVQDLSGILDAEIDAGSMEEKPITFRMYLCRAIGSFDVDDGLPVLLKAVKTNRDEHEIAVRRSALEAIALLAENLQASDPTKPLASPQLTSTLLEAASDSDPLVRSSAAYAMGVVGDADLLAKLQSLLADTYPDVRYNAATGLARQGDVAAAPVLLEMLDPDEQVGIEIEKDEQSRDYKRALIEFNALRAVDLLLKKNSQVDRAQFVPAVEKLLKAKLPNNVQVEATNLLRLLQHGK
jgi:hypothetical protein